MTQLRRDPESTPIGYGQQVLRRPQEDDYGVDGSWWLATSRPFENRNGLTVRLYRYQGTGQSMSHREAQWWLTETVSEVKVCPICDD